MLVLGKRHSRVYLTPKILLWLVWQAQERTDSQPQFLSSSSPNSEKSPTPSSDCSESELEPETEGKAKNKKGKGMDFLFKVTKEDISECDFDQKAIQRCPFLRNINDPTSFSFPSVNSPTPFHASKGPIFEDGSNFDLAFKLFHGKEGVVPLSNSSDLNDNILEPEPVCQFNPLAGKVATISLSALGAGWPFGFGSFNDKWKKQKKKSGSANKGEPSSQKGNTSKHEAMGNEWLETGNCPIAKSYRAVSHVLPIVVSTLQPPPGIKLKCPPAVVAARAALARTAFVKTLRPQPLPAKMFVIALLGMAANVPLGMWKEHTEKFSLSWFAAVHAAMPFIAMVRKSVLMPKTAMALTIGASIMGQVIGSRAERHRLKIKAEQDKKNGQAAISAALAEYSPRLVGGISGSYCGVGMALPPLPMRTREPASPANACC